MMHLLRHVAGAILALAFGAVALVLALCTAIYLIAGCGGTTAPPTPDAALETCASLGCSFALCSSHEATMCSCNGQACLVERPDAGAR